MHKLLVPVDGSDAAWRALEYGVRQVRSAGDGEVHALYVHPPIDVGGKVEVFITEQRMRALASQESARIVEAAAQRLCASNVRHTVEVLEGNPPETIARHATEIGCDAIVMGTRGMGRLGTAIMGSVASQVVHLTSLPITLIK